MRVLVLAGTILTVYGVGFGPCNQDYGYVTVRDKAHMFWWLFYTTATQNSTERPLVIWLQGGPGGSSTGIGNFLEIGPWDTRQHERNFSWVKFVNVLFVDNPVGTGFSFVEDSNFSAFASNNTMIAQDFLVLLRGFLEKVPQFQNVPIYIFGQSYGGKMAADIALLLDKEAKAGNINCHLKGIGLGDAWISPIDSLTSWPAFLLNLGFIDTEGYNSLSIATNFAKKQTDAGRYENATSLFKIVQTIILKMTSVDFYNVLNKIQSRDTKSVDREGQESSYFYLPGEADKELELDQLMNGIVMKSLNLSSKFPFKWGAQSNLVFEAVDLDFMKPVTDVIERILNETDIVVTVYNGQLDLIVDTPGTLAWVNNLKWRGVNEWRQATRNEFAVNGTYEGFEKRYGNFNFYWVNRAGHSVPPDNSNAMEYILRQATDNFAGN